MTLTRRFRLAPGFARLIGRERPAMPVVEGHFPDQSDRRSFLRLEGEACTLILQDLLPDGGVSEERTEVSRAQGEVLMDVCAGRVVYERMPFEGGGGLDIEILRFVSPLPCAFILLHFADSMQAGGFRPPLWFGNELGDEETCEPRQVALGRKPAAHDGAIQNAALESLLDHLETRSGRHGSGHQGSGRGISDLTNQVPAQLHAQATHKPAAQSASLPQNGSAAGNRAAAAPEAAARPAPSASRQNPAAQGASAPRQNQTVRPRTTPATAAPAPSRPQQGDPGDDQDQIFDDGAGKPAASEPRTAGRSG
ncbi:MAG: Protein of unknown function (DUF3117) [Saliniramus fredricksonii]|jgi:hypothetical protein|uniref:Uncharacterized protein n=1 Tax=Saliniramus fredricksonii TaxID=1653334 RepID=A0A0P7Y8P9_9HYPH|nr:hypothetical protein [Saliniramus fredricksonii]KPQ10540.1 MAG: Protein of unknown function (DUF3117) [Saliniramus fredricksonii]SCC79944.1 hypothetical protein GA0071312_1255 [Saliniramus fredricksonii]